MSLFMKQDDTRSRLQQDIAAELQEKARKKAAEEAERPDGVDDSRFIEGTNHTTSRAWIWAVIFVVALIIVVALAM